MQSSHLRLFFSFLLLMSGMFASQQANASFGDCNSPAYLGQFDERLAHDTGFLCVITPPTPVASDAGTTHIRIVQHLVSDWATRPGAMRSFKEGVDDSARAMSTLGGFRISDVTILLVDGYAPGARKENFGQIAAWTNFSPGDECRITIWLLGSGATASYGASVVSHELFHCVQRSSLTAGQLSSAAPLGSSGGGTWWQEGSADWFSTVAVSPPRYMSDRVSAFDSGSARTSLNTMTYDAYVFFAWLGGARGKESVMPFLHAMASGMSAAAQHNAMMSALPADHWLKFAEDYMDQKIRDGHNVSIGSTPQQGENYEWANTRAQRIELTPFVIKRSNMKFQCGRWRITPTPRKFHAAKPGGSESWADFPETIDAMDGTPREFRFVGIAASNSAVALQINGTREAACEECAATREIDRCLLGTWRLTTDGMQQWAREHLRNFQVTSASASNNTMTLNDDRTFSSGDAQVSVSGKLITSESGAHGTGKLAGRISGRWSAARGQFNICPDAGSADGTVKTVVHGRTVTVPMHVGPVGPKSSSYVCSGTTLRVTTQMGSMGPLTSIYTKISGPR